MTENIDNLFIFKSNINTDADLYCIKKVLDIHPHIEQWSIDMEDKDRILRIVSSTLCQSNIIEFVGLHGYTCEELND